MKLSVSRIEMKAALDAIERIVPAKDSVPILSNVLLSSDLATLSITGTDLYLLSATGSVMASVSEVGAITVPAKALREFAGKCYAGQILIECPPDDAKRVKLTCGRARLTLPALPAEDFPQWGGNGGDLQKFSLPAAAIKHLFGRTEHATTRDDQRA